MTNLRLVSKPFGPLVVDDGYGEIPLPGLQLGETRVWRLDVCELDVHLRDISDESLTSLATLRDLVADLHMDLHVEVDRPYRPYHY